MGDLAVLLGDGGDCLSDPAPRGPDPFGEHAGQTTASQPTASRIIEAVAGDELALTRWEQAATRVREKDLGMGNLPCGDFSRNAVRLQLALRAFNLQVLTQALTLDDELARAEPERLRCQLLHIAVRLVRSGRRLTVRLRADWP